MRRVALIKYTVTYWDKAKARGIVEEKQRRISLEDGQPLDKAKEIVSDLEAKENNFKKNGRAPQRYNFIELYLV